METSNFLEICINSVWFSFIKMRILIKIKVSLIVKYNSLIIRKVFQKPSGQFLRVLAKNQWSLKFFDKMFKFTYYDLNGKLTFSPFSIPSSRTLVILYTSGKYHHFLQQFFRFRGEDNIPTSPLAGATD